MDENVILEKYGILIGILSKYVVHVCKKNVCKKWNCVNLIEKGIFGLHLDRQKAFEIDFKKLE